jgi:glycosyltransferase involved in cell wall biosynthesis
MKEKPFFSIIIPTKDRVDLLQKAVNSLSGQSFRQFEVIVVNDGDPGQLPLIENLLSAFTQYVVLQNDQHGVASARNRGAKEASGSFIIFLDDDEFFLEDHLEQLYGAIQAQENKELIFKTGTILEQRGNRQQEGIFTNDRSLMEQVWEFGASMSDFCLPVSVRDKMGFNPEVEVLVDFNYIVKVLSVYPGYFTGAYTVLIPDHCQRISYRKFRRPYHYFSNEVLSVLDTLPFLLADRKYKKLAHQKISRSARAYLYHALKRGSFISALRILLRYVGVVSHVWMK